MQILSIYQYCIPKKFSITFPMDGISAYEIRPTPNKGLGMFASRSIEGGERILCERPLVKLSAFPAPLGEIHKMFFNLSDEDQRSYLQLYAAPIQVDRAADVVGTTVPEEVRERLREVLAILLTNAIHLDSGTGTDSGTGVFGIASRINHSCCSNASYRWNSRIGCLTVHANKAIPIDEEITIAYVNELFNRLYRQQKLERYGFICACSACDETSTIGKASKIRRERLDRLNNDLRFFFKRTLKQEHILGPLSTTVVDSHGVEEPFRAVKKMAKLARQEGLVSDSLAERYFYL